ncbi:MAG: hypothetical protein JNM88_04840 [Chitinophagaceae bacterium]|nr:hypothetical protein [Chitinophagaceae bacterium]
MRKLILCLFIFSFFNAGAQTFDRWAQVVGWDGVTHWSRYMIHMPAYQGPNSLPVPALTNGSIDSNFSVMAGGQLHFSKGDKTQNVVIKANYCLVKDKIAFDLAWVPYERYTMNVATKERRHVFVQFFDDQEAAGEIHLNTNIQLLNKWRKDIHLALRIGYRIPCGSGFGAARYTDGSGYYFDLSFGKQLGQSPLKWIGMAGFYNWQIESTDHNQDDAFLFGTGLEWNTEGLRMQSYVAGYLGYLEKSGDKPVVFRLNAEKKFSRFALQAGFQKGLHDFDFTSVEFGGKYFFSN